MKRTTIYGCSDCGKLYRHERDLDMHDCVATPAPEQDASTPMLDFLLGATLIIVVCLVTGAFRFLAPKG